MSGHVEILVDQKSDAKVMPKTRHYAKTDVRFWKDTIFHRKRGTEEDANWTVQIQYLKRREQFPLDTPNKDAAAAKARDIYLSLHSRGWVETLALYKPQPQPVVVLPEHATVGDLIREVSATTSYRITTFYNYISSLRRIGADLLDIKGDKKRFAAKGKHQWREKVDAIPLSAFTSDAIQMWKLQYLNARKDSPEAHSRAVNTVNAHIRNARALFTAKVLEFAGKRLVLPDPLPFSDVKLERRRTTTRYSSRIDPTALIKDAQKELGETPERREQFKIFCLALLCGLRKREIDTLLWSSVDFEKQVKGRT